MADRLWAVKRKTSAAYYSIINVLYSYTLYTTVYKQSSYVYTQHVWMYINLPAGGTKVGSTVGTPSVYIQ